MLRPAASVLALSLVTACTAATGETSQTSSEALSLVFGDLSVTPTDTTVTIAYEEPGTTPLAVTLGGETITATLEPSGATQSVTFTGLAPCQSYAWSIPAFSGTVSGRTNTRWTGNTACPATEAIAADQLWTFLGDEHQEENNLGCGNWSSTWPVGYGWTAAMTPAGASAAEYTGAQFGYVHYSNGSSWCAESTVQVWRANLVFDVSPTRWARHPTAAALTAEYTSDSNTGAAVCETNLAYVVSSPWQQNTQGSTWAPILGAAESSFGLLADGPATLPINASNGSLSIDYGVPAGRMIAGFASPADGFANLSDGATQAWAADNNKCVTALRNVEMNLTYPPLPPETPICTAALTCSATVTCASSLETFTLESSTGAVLATFDGTHGATPTFTVPVSGSNPTYQVCTSNAAGAKACAPVAIVSNAGCAPPPCVPLTCGSFSGGTCGDEPDGCGGTVDCGSCSPGAICTDNRCLDCTPRACGAGTVYDAALCACAPIAHICPCGGTSPACEICK